MTTQAIVGAVVVRAKEIPPKFWKHLAYRLPRHLVYWCFIRVWAVATTGKYEGEEVDAITMTQALRRWEEQDGI